MKAMAPQHGIIPSGLHLWDQSSSGASQGVLIDSQHGTRPTLHLGQASTVASLANPTARSSNPAYSAVQPGRRRAILSKLEDIRNTWEGSVCKPAFAIVDGVDQFDTRLAQLQALIATKHKNSSPSDFQPETEERLWNYHSDTKVETDAAGRLTHTESYLDPADERLAGIRRQVQELKSALEHHSDLFTDAAAGSEA
jgi:hypothetical protein